MTFSPSSIDISLADRAAARRQSDLCRVFANMHRVLILWMLETGELTVSELAEGLELSMPGTSQHLQRMKMSGVVTTRRDGKLIYYRLTEDKGRHACHLFGQAAYLELPEVG